MNGVHCVTYEGSRGYPWCRKHVVWTHRGKLERRGSVPAWGLGLETGECDRDIAHTGEYICVVMMSRVVPVIKRPHEQGSKRSVPIFGWVLRRGRAWRRV